MIGQLKDTAVPGYIVFAADWLTVARAAQISVGPRPGPLERLQPLGTIFNSYRIFVATLIADSNVLID
jgi:hypothetical protein